MEGYGCDFELFVYL